VSWSDIKRNPFRATKQAAKARKQRFSRIDFPKLLKECEILTEDNKFGYCHIRKEWRRKEEVMR